MRQICPNCQASLTIPDSDAGKSIPCSTCGQSFTVSQGYTAPPSEPLPSVVPPVLALPAPVVASASVAPPSATIPEPPPVKVATPEGYGHLCSLALNRKICEWLTPICFTLVFILSFVNWVGLYPGGYSGYTQNGWQSLCAMMSVNPVSELELNMEAKLNERLYSTWWLLPYVIFMIIGLILAWADRILKMMHAKLPPIVEIFWRYQPAILAACAGVTLFMIVIQSLSGFGVEKAATNLAEHELREDKAKAKTPEQIQRVEMRIDAIRGVFHPETTIWLRFAILFHVLALAGIVGETVLIHRGSKPPPRIGVMW